MLFAHFICEHGPDDLRTFAHRRLYIFIIKGSAWRLHRRKGRWRMCLSGQTVEVRGWTLHWCDLKFGGRAVEVR